MEFDTWRVQWDDAMSVGIPEIDEDHRRFIFLIDGLNRAIVDRMDMEETKRRLQLILDDAVLHFAHEERLFQEWNYPDAEDHARKHAEALRELRAAQERFINYNLPSEWVDVGMKVKDILIGHLLTEDMKYAAYFRDARKAKQSQQGQG